MNSEITLSQLLPPEQILWHPDCHSKKRVFEQVSILLENTCGLPRNDLFSQLISRERLGSTSVGSHGAIPHVRMDQIKAPLCVLVRLEKPIQYDAEDNENSSVNTLFFLFAPEQANDTHLCLLAIFSEMLTNKDFLNALDKCTDALSAHQIISDWESKNTLVSALNPTD